MISSYGVRFYVLRNGARLTTLSAMSAPSVDCSADAEINVSMAGIFAPSPLVNWLTDEIQPVQVIDGVEHPVGVLVPVSYLDTVDANGAKAVQVEAYDRCYILKQAKLEARLHLAAGTLYLDAVMQLLTAAGIALVLQTPSSLTLATDREDWAAGTSYLTVINTLLQEINYDRISFDTSGAAVLRPAKIPSASNIDHEYSQGLRLLSRQASRETDAFDAPNVFVAICSNPDFDAPMSATSVNDSPSSALSTVSRGRRIVSVTNVDNIPDQKSLQDYADRLKMDSMLSTETITVYTANVPGHSVRDTVALWHPELSGIYQEIGWSLVLSEGQRMLHTLRKEVVL